METVSGDGLGSRLPTSFKSGVCNSVQFSWEYRLVHRMAFVSSFPIADLAVSRKLFKNSVQERLHLGWGNDKRT